MVNYSTARLWLDCVSHGLSRLITTRRKQEYKQLEGGIGMEEDRLGWRQEFMTIEVLLADLHSYVTTPYISCPQCGAVFYPESASDTHCVGANS